MREGLELVFIYISEVNYDSYKVGLNFSNDKEFVYSEEDNNITFTNIKTSVAVNFFGNNIYNISALVGLNGVGKTSIMNILGLFQKYRKTSKKIKMIDAKYVILFFDRKNGKFYCENYLKTLDDISNVKLVNCDVENHTISIDTNHVIENSNVLILSNNNSLESEVGSDGIIRSSFGESSKIDMFDFLYLVNENQEVVYNKVFFKKKEQNRSMILIMNTLDVKSLQLPPKSKLYKQGQKVLDCFQLRKSENRELSFAKRMLNNMMLSFFKLEFEMYSYEEKEVYPIPFSVGKSRLKIEIPGKEDKARLDYLYKNICNHVDYINKYQDENKCGVIIKLLYRILIFCEIQNRKKFILLLSEVLLILDKIEKDFVYINPNGIDHVHIRVDDNNKDDLRKIAEYIDCYEELLNELLNNRIIMNPVVVFDFLGLSSGEQALVNQFASLNTKIQKEVKKFSSSSNNDEVTTIIIILDEYELHLHPEWSRIYLQNLTHLLDYYDDKKNIVFQVILTTHSPYLISDLPKENIILLEKDEETGKRTARKSNYGFASNYYDIMSDSFFLDDTIGEFAKQKINSCIRAINRISDRLTKILKQKKISHDSLQKFIKKKSQELERQNQIIDLVGDKFIQKQLQQLSDSVKQRLLAHSDNSVRKQQLKQDIAELEERIQQKKMELKND